MENNRFIKYFTLATLMGMLIASPFFVFAYNDKTTHPALTDEIVDLFNLYYPNAKIENADKELIKNGSIEEDSGARWMNHFYDPIYNRGLWGYLSSKEWALNTAEQASLDLGYAQGGSIVGKTFAKPFDSQTDYSWDRAIYDYVWADKKRGLEGLGHILHLLEDMSVPDHTRNDPHPAVLDLGSPYESWTAQFNDKNIDGLALNIFNAKLKPHTFKIIQEPFYSLAKYSNENFFSKDTILDKEYPNPIIDTIQIEKLSNQKNYKFGYKITNGDQYRVVRVEKLLGDSSDNYSLLDQDDLILNDYWTRLSKQAVLHGVGVVKLFLEEADKERTSKMRLSRNKSFLDKLSSSINSWFSDDVVSPLIASLPSGAFDVSTPVLNISSGASQITQQLVPANTVLNTLNSPASENTSNLTVNAGSAEQIAIIATSSQNNSTNADASSFASSISPGFGGGGGSSGVSTDNSQNNSTSNVEQDAPQETTESASSESLDSGEPDQDLNSEPEESPIEVAPQDTTPPSAPTIVEPANNKIFTTNEIIFRGTAETSSIISQSLNSDTTNTDKDGAWEFELFIEQQGTSTIEFYASDTAGNISSSTPIEIFVDSLAPDISLVVSQCDASLSPESCLVATSTIALQWFSSATVIDYFEIVCTFNSAQCENFDFQNTKATSTAYTITQGDGKYEFRAKAFDESGNVSDETSKEITISNHPVIINEIAWAGTSASANDEWVELYNRTDQTISLNGWTLYAKTNAPYISLSGTIAPHSYYFMERTDDNTVSDISADLIYGNDGPNWALNNSSEQLFLSYASTTIDETPICYHGSQWCAGSAQYQYLSMERIDPDIVGTVGTNWKSAMDEFIKNGKDAKEKVLNATPKARNGAHYLVSSNSSISFDTTLTKNNSPYLIGRNGLTLEAGASLTIEPGVVIKFVSPNEPTFWVKGTMKALGTAENPIVFTSFYDDEYGGDMNADGVCDKTNPSSKSACPFAGAWRRIHFMPSSIGSEFDNVIVRYGGRWFNDGWPRSMVYFEKTDATVRNSTFEYSQKYGLQISGAGGLIENSIFQNNNVDTESAGLITSGNATIRDNTFNNNYFGLTLQSSLVTVENNTFNNNKSYAANVSGGLNSFVGNSGAGNGIDGIKIVGQLNATTSPLVMHQNQLPYIIGSGVYLALEIPDQSIVDVDPGVVFKAQSDGIINVKGVLNIHGDSKESVVFGPLLGDNSPADWWRGINVGKTGFLNGTGFTVRRAGQGCPFGTPCAGLLVDGGKAQVQNARFDNNYTNGVRLSKSVGSTFSDVEFINHNEPNIPANDSMRAIGLAFFDSDVGLGSLVFSNNNLGAYSTNSTISHIDSYAVDFSANVLNSIPPDLF